MDEDEAETEPDEAVKLEETGPFHPAAHHETQTKLAGEGSYRGHATIERRGHPALACPDPRHPATLRGFYRCPACGAKVQLAGQIRAAELGQELGERWAEALAGGVGQAAGLTWDLLLAIARGIMWAWSAGKNRLARTEKDGGVTPELIRAVVLMGMVAARYTPPADPKLGQLTTGEANSQVKVRQINLRFTPITLLFEYAIGDR